MKWQWHNTNITCKFFIEHNNYNHNTGIWHNEHYGLSMACLQQKWERRWFLRYGYQNDKWDVVCSVNHHTYIEPSAPYITPCPEQNPCENCPMYLEPSWNNRVPCPCFCPSLFHCPVYEAPLGYLVGVELFILTQLQFSDFRLPTSCCWEQELFESDGQCTQCLCHSFVWLVQWFTSSALICYFLFVCINLITT